jgi:lipoyl(octanoyl) transferase
MSLEVLPTRTSPAAENMAVDFLMLQRYPREQLSRFRHYSWRSPAFTFGYSQKISFVRASLPAGQIFDLCRRPTGGGIVDHRDDWTFSLVIPRGHPLELLRATESYREVHDCLAAALRRQGVPAITKNASMLTSSAGAANSPAGLCFDRSEPNDVVHETSGAKIAGAAQKRNKRGLLFQGSVWRPALGRAIDEGALLDDFVKNLSVVLGTSRSDVPWPDFQEDEVSGLAETYASAEWNEGR